MQRRELNYECCNFDLICRKKWKILWSSIFNFEDDYLYQEKLFTNSKEKS